MRNSGFDSEIDRMLGPWSRQHDKLLTVPEWANVEMKSCREGVREATGVARGEARVTGALRGARREPATELTVD